MAFSKIAFAAALTPRAFDHLASPVRVEPELVLSREWFANGARANAQRSSSRRGPFRSHRVLLYRCLHSSASAARSERCWRFAPPCCAGQSVSECVSYASDSPKFLHEVRWRMLAFIEATTKVRLMSIVEQRPNPSVEGTSNIWLRQLSAAPHLKR